LKTKRVMLLLACAAILMTWTLPWAEEARERVEIKPALLVIDVQNQWMPKMAEEDRATAPDSINAAIALFREYGHPVIRVYHSDPKRGPEPGTEAFEFPESIAVTDADPKVVKAHPSSFAGTDLEEILRDGDRNVVFLCGLSATGCVLATYFGGMEREFTCLMVKGALLSGNAEYTAMIDDICYSVTLEELRGVMEDSYFE
jgi:nicotinamidase-related amidase